MSVCPFVYQYVNLKKLGYVFAVSIPGIVSQMGHIVAAPYEYVIRTCPLLLKVKLDNWVWFNILFFFLFLGHVTCITVPLDYHKIACPSISNNEIAEARPNLNIKVAAYVKA